MLVASKKAFSVLQGEIGFFLNIVRKEHSEIDTHQESQT